MLAQRHQDRTRMRSDCVRASVMCTPGSKGAVPEARMGLAPCTSSCFPSMQLAYQEWITD